VVYLTLSRQNACVIFNKLVVNNIEDSSGIFIGTNQAIGWSSYGKTNNGFGSLKDATLSHSVNIVYDSDVIDSSLKEVRYLQLTETTNAQHCAVEFESINANSVNNGSAIDLGDNKQLGWRSSRKINYGTGKAFGRNRLNGTANIIFDNDVVDAPVHTEGKIIENRGNIEKDIQINQLPKI
jgi:hypothetical protein